MELTIGPRLACQLVESTKLVRTITHGNMDLKDLLLCSALLRPTLRGRRCEVNGYGGSWQVPSGRQWLLAAQEGGRSVGRLGRIGV